MYFRNVYNASMIRQVTNRQKLFWCNVLLYGDVYGNIGLEFDATTYQLRMHNALDFPNIYRDN